MNYRNRLLIICLFISISSVSGCYWVAYLEINQMFVHVGPFLHHLTAFDAPADSFFSAGANAVLACTIRLLNVTVHSLAVTDTVQLASQYQDLHQLNDAFK